MGPATMASTHCVYVCVLGIVSCLWLSKFATHPTFHNCWACQRCGSFMASSTGCPNHRALGVVIFWFSDQVPSWHCAQVVRFAAHRYLEVAAGPRKSDSVACGRKHTKTATEPIGDNPSNNHWLDDGLDCWWVLSAGCATLGPVGRASPSTYRRWASPSTYRRWLI